MDEFSAGLRGWFRRHSAGAQASLRPAPNPFQPQVAQWAIFPVNTSALQGHRLATCGFQGLHSAPSRLPLGPSVTVSWPARISSSKNAISRLSECCPLILLRSRQF